MVRGAAIRSFGFMLAALVLLAATAVPLELTRVTTPIVVDGVMDDAGWREVDPLPLTMYVPVFRGTPTQRTEIRVAYDDEALYFGGWMFDTDPKGIRVNSLYRDRWNGDDALAIYLDAFNDNQNAKWFGITPAGMRFDLLVSDDGNTTNDNWDSFWTTKTSITADGWFVEVRIPFSSLGFQTGDDGRAVMGLTVTRLVSRIEERVTFPAIDPKFPFRRPSMAQDVVLRGVRSEKPLYVTPYLLGGSTRTPLNENETETEAGVDVRYPITSNMTIDLTANTDFAQVEADNQQVALDRFPLFFPERRRFFQEGAGLFDFVTANGGRLFHSRRIGLDAQLQPQRILGGARLVGRVGQWEVGMLEMQVEGENFGVFRVRRPVLNASSTAGVLATTYFADGRRNLALGGDTTLRVTGDEYVTLKAASTTGGGNLFDVRWERRTGRGLSYSLQAGRANKEYVPELGFMPRRDYTTANAVANWYIFTDKSRYFRRVYPGALAFSTFRNSDNELESAQYAVWIQWDAKGGGGGWIEPKGFRENVLTPFSIGNKIRIPAGVYDFADLQFVYTMPGGSRLRTDVDFRAGTYFDGKRTQLIVTPTWNASRHLELGADYQLTRLRFDARNQRDDIQLARFRVRAALNTRASANAFVQYNSTTQRIDFNVRLRYTVTEGTDLWLVYNEGLENETRSSLSRAMIVKYSHTFTF
jgi:Domain of unknown function (DUF5916)/Carbohydrate family 9 binding domain-like